MEIYALLIGAEGKDSDRKKVPDPEPHLSALEGELSPVMPAAAGQLQRFKSAVGLALAMVKLWPLEVARPSH